MYTLAVAFAIFAVAQCQYGYGGGHGGGYGGGYGGKGIGKEIGFEKGFEQGKEVAKEIGFEKGLEMGKEIGIEEGKELGKEIGLEKGFEKGIELEKGIGIGGGHLGYGVPGWAGHPGAKLPLVNVIKKEELIYNPLIKKVPFKVHQPIIKLPAYKPKFDITPFLKPAEVIIDDYVPPVQKFRAPPKYITRPTIFKEIEQDIFISQPIQVTKTQKIHKKEQVNVIKGPAIVDEEKVPVVEVKPEIGFGHGGIKPDVDVKPIGPIGGYAAKARRA